MGCPATSVGNYHFSLRNIPQERSSHLPRGGSMQSRIEDACVGGKSGTDCLLTRRRI